MRLTLLGTGTPSPSRRRKSSGYVLEVSGATIALDHGGGAFDRLVESGIAPVAVTHLLVSHLHSDHTLDLARLVLSRWDQGGGRLAPLEIAGPAPLSHMLDALMGPEGAFAPDIRARCEHPASLAIHAARGGVPPRDPPRWTLAEVAPGMALRVGEASRVATGSSVPPSSEKALGLQVGGWESEVTSYELRVACSSAEQRLGELTRYKLRIAAPWRA